MKHALILALSLPAPLSAAVRAVAPVRVAPSFSAFAAQAGLGFTQTALAPGFSALNAPSLSVLPSFNSAVSPSVLPTAAAFVSPSAAIQAATNDTVSAVPSAATPGVLHKKAVSDRAGFSAQAETARAEKSRGPEHRESLTALAAARPSSTGMHFNAFYSGAVLRPGTEAVVVPEAARLNSNGGWKMAGVEPNPGGSRKEPAKPFVYRWGMKSEDLPGRTALEKHLAFFDTVGDGIVTVARVFTRLRQLGFSFLEAAVVAPGIQAGIRGIMGQHASKGLWARLNLEVRVADAHLIGRKGTHHIFDKEGNIDAEKLRLLYVKSKLGPYYLPTGRMNTESYLTSEMMFKLVEDNAKAEDPGFAGRKGNRIEWELMFKHFADGYVMEAGKKVPVMTAKSLQKFYDGRLFYEKAGDVEIERSQARKRR